MKKATTAIAFLLCIAVSPAKAQNFMHSAGVAFNILNAKINTPYERYTSTVAFTNLSWYPRFTLTEMENSSVSVGAPLGVGVGFANAGAGAEASLYYGVDLPLVVDYNIGRKATPDLVDGFGGYFGAGYGYTLTNWTDGESTDNLNSYGPLVRGGVRFGVRDDRHPDWAITIGLSYKFGMDTWKYKTYGIQVMIDF